MAGVKKAPEAVPTLDAYIAPREARKLPVVLSSVTHPAPDRAIFEGRFGGIRIEQGPIGCVWSDGSRE
jgi:hypothetical protein